MRVAATSNYYNSTARTRYVARNVLFFVEIFLSTLIDLPRSRYRMCKVDFPFSSRGDCEMCVVPSGRGEGLR